MFAFLLTLLILDSVLLMVVVLLQSGKGGGLAAMGGGGTSSDSLVGGRQATTILTKTSWIGGGAFLALALVLAVMSSRSDGQDSILREEFQQTTPVAPQPVLPGLQPGEQTDPGDGAAAPQVPGTDPATGAGAEPPGGRP